MPNGTLIDPDDPEYDRLMNNRSFRQNFRQIMTLPNRPIDILVGSRFLRAFNSRQVLVSAEEEATQVDERTTDKSIQELLRFNKRFCKERKSWDHVLCTHAPTASPCEGKCSLQCI